MESQARGSRGGPQPGLLPRATPPGTPAPINAESGCGNPPALPGVLVSVGDEGEKVLGQPRP